MQRIKLKEIGVQSRTDNIVNYYKGCLFSPDGRSILTVVNGLGINIVNVPDDLLENEFVLDEDRPMNVLEADKSVNESGTVYDYSWLQDSSGRWLSTFQHEPIKLYSRDCEILGSYRGYDDFDEVEAALSVTNSSDTERIIGGYKKNIKIFNTERPGRDYQTISTKCPISTVASSENLIAAGSWNRNIVMFDDRSPESASFFMGHSGGITLIKFATSNYILVGARKNDFLLLWDLRNLQIPAVQFTRCVETNQRVQFDYNCDQNLIISGDTRGFVNLWSFDEQEDKSIKYLIHRDCCNGVSLHPTKPILATTSGQHHNLNDMEDDSEIEFIENSLNLWYIMQ